MTLMPGFRHEKTGFPGVLEKWVDKEHSYAIMFVLRPDRNLQNYWRRSWPDVHALALKSRPERVVWVKEDRTLIVKAF